MALNLTNKSYHSSDVPLDSRPLFFEEWFVFRRNHHYGPFTQEEIKALLKSGYLEGQHHFWKSGFENWERLDSHPLYSGYVSPIVEDISDRAFEVSYVAAMNPSALKNTNPNTIDRNDYHLRELKPDSPHQNHSPIVYSQLANWSKSNYKSLKLIIQRISKNRQLHQTLKIMNKHKKVLLVLIFLALVGPIIYVFETIGVRSSPNYPKIPIFNRQDARRIILSKKTNRRPKFLILTAQPLHTDSIQVYSKPEISRDLLVISNLSIGTKIDIKFESVRNNILGQTTTMFETNHSVISSILAISNPLSHHGVTFPDGLYNLTITCSTCPTNNVFTQKKQMIYIGRGNEQNFKSDLAKYHSQMRAQATLELDELDFILELLKSQWSELHRLVQNINLLQAKHRRNSWLSTKVGWTKIQTEISSAFVEMNDPEFRAKLYYSSHYTALRKLSIRLNGKFVELESYFRKQNSKAWRYIFKDKQFENNLSLATNEMKKIRDLHSKSKKRLPKKIKYGNKGNT